jgi:hypothetical protein
MHAGRTIAFSAVAIWGLLICFWNIGVGNVNEDELTYTGAGWEYVHGDFRQNREHPPTAKYLFGVAQLIGGEGVLAPRVVVGILVMAVAAVLFLWVRREVGWWPGLAAAALWLLTPRNVGDVRIDRMALLEPVMIAFAVFALYAAWLWIRDRQIWLLPVSAALMALSVTAKVTTVALLPALLLLPFLFRQARAAVTGGLLWLAVFLTVCTILYLPMGIRSAVAYMLQFQSEHSAAGHLVQVAGETFAHPPWWADLWFMVEGMGVITVALLVVGTALAVVVHPDRLVAYVATALGLLVVFYLVFSPIALGHYYYVWTPFMAVLAAVGYGRLAKLAPTRVRPTAVVVPVVLAGIAAVTVTGGVLATRPTGIALVDDIVPSGRILVARTTPAKVDPYLGERATFDPDAGPFAAVAIGSDERFPVDPRIEAALQAADVREHSVDDFTVYVSSTGSLTVR